MAIYESPKRDALYKNGQFFKKKKKKKEINNNKNVFSLQCQIDFKIIYKQEFEYKYDDYPITLRNIFDELYHYIKEIHFIPNLKYITYKLNCSHF